jgi:aspartyl-tRNA synthetase
LPPIDSWKRTHTCGQLREGDKGKAVTLLGWVANHRDFGGVIFIDLRDRWGITQIVFHPEKGKSLNEAARNLTLESVIGVRGEVQARPHDMVRSNLATGGIEVTAVDLNVFNEAKTCPFQVKDPSDASDDLRLKYRYLDLRRPSVQNRILFRHSLAKAVREFFDNEGFVDVETPFLMKSTPEGARDYLVPSRIHRRRFYALPQSPQTYKQLLMVAGFDRYYQIVRCFRDEDLRADRQPEFTQIDVEMSFIDENDIIGVIERLVHTLFRRMLARDLPIPFPRMPYSEALRRYGTDRPDIRFGMEILDVGDPAGRSGYRIFEESVKAGGTVQGIRLEGVGPASRKTVDIWTEHVRGLGGKGLGVISMAEGSIQSPLTKFIAPDVMNELVARFKAGPGDVLFLVADKAEMCRTVLGNLRLALAQEYKKIPEQTFAPLWVVDFPLLEWNEEESRWEAMHHPFTSPREEDLPLMDSDPRAVRARAYDLVLNGSEVAGGSIRNHRRSVQEGVFRRLGMDPDLAQRKFGYLMEALEYGAPPHGGIAFGFDRLTAMMTGERSIREVIAFPKTTSALSLMDGSPSEVDSRQLDELGLRFSEESPPDKES